MTTDYAPANWIPSPNYTTGRQTPPQYIVDHWTVGSAASCIATFRSKASQVSAHYLVCRDGSIVQFVREQDTAWHNAQPGWNAMSIGIEHEHIPGQDWPEVQIAASRLLHRDIGLPNLGHKDTGYATQCPGDLIEQLEEELTFKDDPDAIAYREDVKNTFEAIKQVLAAIDARLDGIAKAATR